jgi:hypothetical protein
MQVVRIDTRGRVLDQVVRVSKGNSERVMWVALGNGGPWTITFDKPPASSDRAPFEPGSPFDQVMYEVERGSFKITAYGPKADAREDKTYKYNVRNSDGKITDDPDIDIEG